MFRMSKTWTFTKLVTLVSCHFLQHVDKFLHPVPTVYLLRTNKIETVGLVWDMKDAKSSWFTVSEKRFYDPKRTGSWQSWLLLPLSNVQFSRELCDVWSALEKLSSDFYLSVDPGIKFTFSNWFVKLLQKGGWHWLKIYVCTADP